LLRPIKETYRKELLKVFPLLANIDLKGDIALGAPHCGEDVAVDKFVTPPVVSLFFKWRDDSTMSVFRTK
jgi:hypothetical protein